MFNHTTMDISQINPRHNLYVVKTYGAGGMSYIKLGYSSDNTKRLRVYIATNPLIEILYTFYRPDAKYFELKLHKEIESVHAREWYESELLDSILAYIKNGEQTLKMNSGVKAVKEDYTTFFDRLRQGLENNNKVRNTYDRFKAFGLLDDDIEDIFHLGNKKVINKAENEYSLRYSEDAAIRALRKAILTEFKTNTWYPSHEIKERVCRIVNEHGGECNSSKKAVEILKYLFEASSESHRIEGKKVRGIFIKSTK